MSGGPELHIFVDSKTYSDAQLRKTCVLVEECCMFCVNLQGAKFHNDDAQHEAQNRLNPRDILLGLRKSLRARAALAVTICRLLRGLLQCIVVFLGSCARWVRHIALLLDSGTHRHYWNCYFSTPTHIATTDCCISRLPCAMRWTYCCIARLLCATGQTYHRQLPTAARTEATSIYALDSAARQCSSLLQWYAR